MIVYLTLDEVLAAHAAVLEASGGMPGIRDAGALEASVASPRMTYDGEDLYPSVAEKAASLAFALAQNHPFVDGNKRVAYVAMETFLVTNGYELSGGVDEQESLVLALARGEVQREELAGWIARRSELLSHPITDAEES